MRERTTWNRAEIAKAASGHAKKPDAKKQEATWEDSFTFGSEKAALCVRLARAILPMTAPEAAVEDQALAFMHLPEEELNASYYRLLENDEKPKVWNEEWDWSFNQIIDRSNNCFHTELYTDEDEEPGRFLMGNGRYNGEGCRDREIARLKLASAAPEMARLLSSALAATAFGLPCIGCDMEKGTPHEDHCELMTVLKKAGVL